MQWIVYAAAVAYSAYLTTVLPKLSFDLSSDLALLRLPAWLLLALLYLAHYVVRLRLTTVQGRPAHW